MHNFGIVLWLLFIIPVGYGQEIENTPSINTDSFDESSNLSKMAPGCFYTYGISDFEPTM
jgi:hypothetical protein